MYHLTRHFTLMEMIRSDYAIRHGIDNTPTPTIVDELRLLCQALERVRLIFAQPIVVTSGYRCKALNTAIGGSATSQHVKGQAADYTVRDVSNLAVVHAIARSEIAFDQLIYEFGEAGWIHMSRSDHPRHQVLRAFRYEGVTRYEPMDVGQLPLDLSAGVT